jgi:hypothetical protein
MNDERRRQIRVSRAVRAMLPLVAVLAVMPPSSIRGQTDALHLRAQVSARVNAVYHAACLAEWQTCSRSIFEQWWKTRLGWTAADESAIDSWRQILKAVSDSAPPRPAAPVLLNTLQFHPSQATRELVLTAAMESPTSEAFSRRTRTVLSQAQADRLIAAIDYVERRLKASADETASIERRLRQVEDTAARMQMPQMAAAMAAFLDAKLPSSDIYVDAIIPPDPKSSAYQATQIGSHLVVEMVDSVQPAEIVSVALHELTHYMYDHAPREQHLALVDEFMGMDTPASTGLYTYLNEAVASAAQGVLARRRGEHEDHDKAYDHPYIAPLGAATVPILENALQRGGTLFAGFSAPYAAAGAAALGGKVTQPRFVLSQTAIMVSDSEEDQRLAKTYLSTMFPSISARLSDESLLKLYPELNVIRFVRADGIDKVGLAAERDRLIGHRAFGYALRRGRKAWTCVLGGRDAAAIQDAIARLGDLPRLTSEGLLFTID